MTANVLAPPGASADGPERSRTNRRFLVSSRRPMERFQMQQPNGADDTAEINALRSNDDWSAMNQSVCLSASDLAPLWASFVALAKQLLIWFQCTWFLSLSDRYPRLRFSSSSRQTDRQTEDWVPTSAFQHTN
jgi:hypothetical protein